jgi:hypothetical protein
MTDVRTQPSPTTAWKPLAGFAVAFTVLQQAGTVFRFLGDVGDTRRADWVDLLTPWVVLGLGLLVLLRAGASRRILLAFGAAGLLYAEGHALHLSANSISNARPSGIVHLWDEVVSHYVWYSGAMLILIVLTLALRDQAAPRRTWPGYPLAVLVGFTLLNGWIEGGVPVLGFVSAAGLIAAGGATRSSVGGRYALTAGLVGLLALAGWGIYWGYFPEYSELGWI